MVGLAVGAALHWVGVVGWGAYSVVLGVALGVSLFAGDQPTGRVFLGERRPPPRRVWLAQMLFAAAFLAAITVLITALAVVHDDLLSKLRPANTSLPNREPFPFRILSHDVGPAVFAAYWLRPEARYFSPTMSTAVSCYLNKPSNNHCYLPRSST